MKKIILSVAVLAFSGVLFAQKTANSVAKFENETIDLGKIKQGSPTTAKFIVNNITAEPLIIEQASPTCGCTISDYTKEPISAGKTGFINATYNAAGIGVFEKHLTVKFAGVDEVKSITLKGEVVSTDDFVKVQAELDAKAKAEAEEKAKAAAAAATAAKPKATTSKKSKKTKKTTTTPATAKTN